MLAELIGTFIIALSIAYIYYKFVIFNFWRRKGVFYMEPVVPTGNITDVLTGKTHVGVLFHDAYMKYKHHRAFGMYTFFKPNLIITDLDLIRMVLTKEFKSFHDRGVFCNEKIDPLTGNLFFMSGKRWRDMRIKMTPTFTSGKIKQMFPIMKECSEELAKYLENKAQMRDSVEMKDMFSRYSMDVIMSTAFGIESNCIEEPYNEYQMQGKKALKLHPIWIVLTMFLPKIMDFFSIPFTYRSITNFYMNMFQKNVEYRKTQNIVRNDFMNLLMQLMERGYIDPEDEKTNISSTINKLTMTEATAQSYAFFLAGFETSSSTATLALYELAQHQDMQDKVRKEIDEILEYGVLTYDAVNKATYLHKVINGKYIIALCFSLFGDTIFNKETMRKYPALPILNRICTKEIDLPTINIRVPEGTLITIPVLGLHRDPSIYPNPDKFDPERFNADQVAKRHPYAYLPFGEGPRICIGARFGYLQTKVGLIYLLSKYKFKLDSQTPVPLIFYKKCPGIASKNGIHLIIEPRSK